MTDFKTFVISIKRTLDLPSGDSREYWDIIATISLNPQVVKATLEEIETGLKAMYLTYSIGEAKNCEY